MEQNKLIAIVAVYNAIYDGKNYIKMCLDSIAAQTYKNYEVVVLDDCSTDGTWETINEYPFHKLRNPVHNCRGFYNQLQAMWYLPLDGEAVYMIIDGDDHLVDNKVFEDVNNMYQNGVLLTYGKFNALSGSYGEFGSPDINTKTYRRTGNWVTSHLKTFKRKLFTRIADADLRYEDGEYYKILGDATMMYPMIEMAGKDHIRCADRVLYVYNDMHPPGDHYPIFKKEIRHLRHKRCYPRMIWK